MVLGSTLKQKYRRDERSHAGHAIERCHDHDDYDFGLQERVVEVAEVHVNMIDRHH